MGDTQDKQLNMFKTSALEHENDLNGPSIATRGWFRLNFENSALTAVGAAEFDNCTGNTLNDNSLAICVDSRASEHYVDEAPGLRRRLSDPEIYKEPRKITTAGKHRLEGDATKLSPTLSSTKLE